MEQGRHTLYRLSRVHCCSTSDSQPSQDRSTPGSYIPVSSIHLDVTSMMTKTCSVNSKCLIDDSVWLVCDWQASTTLAIAGLYVFFGGPKWCAIQKLLWVFLTGSSQFNVSDSTDWFRSRRIRSFFLVRTTWLQRVVKSASNVMRRYALSIKVNDMCVCVSMGQCDSLSLVSNSCLLFLSSCLEMCDSYSAMAQAFIKRLQ